jgi:Flp pilus assembly protein TadD
VLTGDTDDSTLPMQVGLVLAAHESWSYAELAFEYAAAGPSPGAALAYLGFVRDQQGKDGGAQINQAVTLDPTNPQVRLLQGLHLRQVSDYDGSLNALAHAATLDARNPVFVAELGTTFWLSGDLSQAEYWLQVAVVLSDNDADFQDILDQFYADVTYSLSDFGLDELEPTTIAYPTDSDLQAGYGWALYTSGDAESGMSLIDDALALDPANPRALFYKARIEIDAGNISEAIPLLQQVVQMNADFAADAQSILQDLGFSG